MSSGTIKMLSNANGVGFISPSDPNHPRELYFHFSSVEGGQPVFDTLRTGDLVVFDIQANGEKHQAIHVRPSMP